MTPRFQHNNHIFLGKFQEFDLYFHLSSYFIIVTQNNEDFIFGYLNGNPYHPALIEAQKRIGLLYIYQGNS